MFYIAKLEIHTVDFNPIQIMPVFTAAITIGASPINPDTIEITDRFVVYKKRKIYLIGYAPFRSLFRKILLWKLIQASLAAILPSKALVRAQLLPIVLRFRM
jgi:hypothetical protein